jgi:site-specific recombinase XerC
LEAVKSPAEQRVLLRNVSLETYERLLAEREESRVPRFAYDRGMLQIMSPSTELEHTSHIIGLLVEVLAEEMNVNVYGVGSTTFRREIWTVASSPMPVSMFRTRSTSVASPR